MPIVRRSVRALAAACLVAATLLSAVPRPAAALEPPRPLPHYRPAFVTETDTRPWKDCLWASGAMLLDKLTNGDRTISHQRLRQLSRDLKGGSLLPDLATAYRKLGVKLVYSPDGGARITWAGLLRRLAHGAGAVLLGDDSKLPRWYGRWDYRFWKGKGKTDNHAVYVERYDRRHGRVWLMDPLAPEGWRGEWISVWALQRFTWSRGGVLFAAVTPTAKPAPFAGVHRAAPALTQTATRFEAAWPISAPRRWRFPGADVRASYRRVTDPLRAAVIDGRAARRGGASAPARRATARVTGRRLTSVVPLPTKPGAYVARVRLTERRFGRTVVDTGQVVVFVPGPRSATLRIDTVGSTAQAGDTLGVSISVTNSGSMAWGDPAPGLVARGAAAVRGTHLVARWIQLSDAAGQPSGDEAAPAPVELDPLPLAPGGSVVIDQAVRVPDVPGRWALAIDIVDDVDGSFAARGSAPASAEVDVVAQGGADISG